MSPTVRGIVAVVVGVVTAAITVFAIEAVSSALYPLPPGVDPMVPEQLRAHLASLPTLAFLIVLSAWVIGTFVGGVVAVRIAGRSPVRYAGIIGGFILAGTILNLVTLPHPAWVAVLALILIPVATWAASRMGGGPATPVSS